MDFFESEGYYEAADKFCQECASLPTELDDKSREFMRRRSEIRCCIANGDIDRSIMLINEYNPGILDKNQPLFFALLQQKLVEMIRNERLEEALLFAQEEVAPLAEENVSWRFHLRWLV